MDKAIKRGKQTLPAYPGPVTLYRSWKKFAWFGGISALFTLGGVGMILDPTVNRWDAWGVEVFFGLFTIVFTVGLLLPGRDCMTLGPTDFEVVQFFRRWRARWEDVSDFSVWTSRRNEMVVFNDRTNKGLWGALSARISRRNGSLPDTYGYTGAALARLMNDWRTQALTAQSQQSAQNEAAMPVVDNRA